MDKTFVTIHPNEAHWEGPEQDHFFLTKAFKKLADKKVKKFAAKTAAQSGLSPEQQKVFVDTVVTKSQPVTKKAANSATLVTLGALGSAGGFALAPLFAGGAAGAGAAGAAGGSGVATGGTVAAGSAGTIGIGKKLADSLKAKTSAAVDKATKAGSVVLKEYDKLPQSVKENLASAGKDVLSKIKIGDKTAADLLPKNRSEVRMENEAQNKQALSSMSGGINMQWILIGLAVVVIIGIIVKHNKG